MKVKDAAAFVEKRINELEQALYAYEHITKPRAERDREILETLREQHMKMLSLLEKDERGEKVTTEDIQESVPKELL